jgi:hypothetical protein
MSNDDPRSYITKGMFIRIGPMGSFPLTGTRA